jgi:hypothetical protein
VQAGMQQVAEPPSAPDSSYAQRQEQALAEARGPQENAAELRQLMQQQQQSQQKPNLLQVCPPTAHASKPFCVVIIEFAAELPLELVVDMTRSWPSYTCLTTYRLHYRACCRKSS